MVNFAVATVSAGDLRSIKWCSWSANDRAVVRKCSARHDVVQAGLKLSLLLELFLGKLDGALAATDNGVSQAWRCGQYVLSKETSGRNLARVETRVSLPLG